MARAVEDLAGDRIRSGLVVTKDGHGLPLRQLPLREAAHPVPDARSEAVAREALALVSTARSEDILLVLLSGGASALLSCPAAGLCAGDLAETTRLLLGSGADIEELNAVRKHLSAISGGRLASAARCERIEVLAVSDVAGDRFDVIGSGPCSADPSSYADALAVLARRVEGARVPAEVMRHLASGAAGEIPDTPGPGDPLLERVHETLVARSRDAVAAAARAAAAAGLRPVVLGEVLVGEARRVGTRLAHLAGSVAAGSPLCLIASGETTVTLRGSGRGGRNQELALAAAVAFDGMSERENEVVLLSAGSDGSDGPTPAAGAFADRRSVERAKALGCDAWVALAQNDSHGFFSREGGLLVTGPTGTNVMDLVLILVEPAIAPRGKQE
jgi:glycerate-2-kinase